MLKADLEKIVTSLSAIERKSFRIHYKHQSGDGKYGELFEMYLSAISGKAAAETSFRIKYPTTSFDNTAAYLFKVLTEMLTMGRIQQDPWFGQLFSVMKAKVIYGAIHACTGLKRIKANPAPGRKFRRSSTLLFMFTY